MLNPILRPRRHPDGVHGAKELFENPVVLVCHHNYDGNDDQDGGQDVDDYSRLSLSLSLFL